MKNAVLTGIAGALLLLFVTAGAAGAPSATVAAGDWTGFGRTNDNMRHSPLTQITKANVGQLGRVYNIDLHALDSDTRRGEQSYPLAIGGTLYVTTNDAQVFALRRRDRQGHLALQAVEQRPLQELRDRREPRPRLLRRRALPADARHAPEQAQPGERRAARARRDRRVGSGRRLELRLLRDQRADLREPPRDRRRRRLGVRRARLRDGVDDRPAPGLAEPGAGRSRRSSRAGARRAASSAAAPSGRPSRSTPRTNTVFFGTGSATPLYFPSIRPGTNPRTDSLIAVDLKTGQMKWWRQLIAGNQWSYDVAQPPLVYDGKVGGKTHHVVSVATMEGVWFAFDANTGAPFYQRVKVIDRVEHPALQPGKPVTVFPSSLGGLNYSPASYDPATNYVFNAAAETAARRHPGAADADAEEAQVRARRRVPRSRERQLRHRARRAGTTTARSARSTSTPASASGSSRRLSRSAAA